MNFEVELHGPTSHTWSLVVSGSCTGQCSAGLSKDSPQILLSLHVAPGHLRLFPLREVPGRLAAGAGREQNVAVHQLAHLCLSPLHTANTAQRGLSVSPLHCVAWGE